MKPNQPKKQLPQEDHGNAEDRQTFPFRKRLLSSGPKPKNGSATPDPQALKKTRDLPNLSECHGCGFRIDACDGKSRVQALYSEWRIVLLCKKCFSGVESSEICSYCFKETSKRDCFRCFQCKRCVHKMCFSEYKAVPPWSYSCPGMDFSLCVDCWVPKPIASKRGALRSRRRSKKSRVSETGDSIVSEPGNSRVLDGENCPETESLEDVVKDANCVVEKKIEAAARARETAMRKAMVAKKAIELASNALGLVANKDQTATKESSGDCNVVDDSELAFQLHRAMNSSPRISKTLCLLNSRCFVGERMWNCHSDLLGRSSPSGNASVSGKLEVCTNKKLHQNPDRSASRPPVGVRITDHGFSTDRDYLKLNGRVYVRSRMKDGKCGLGSRRVNPTNTDYLKPNVRVYVRTRMKDGKRGLGLRMINPTEMDYLKPKGKVYVRTRFKDCKCRRKFSGDLENVEVRLNEGEGSCSTKLINSSWDDSSMNSAFRSCHDQDLSTVPKVERSSENPDRYLIKYKRKLNLKSATESRYKFLYEGFLHQIQSSASGPPLNCSKESRTYSNISLQSCDFPVLSSACESGSFRDQF